MLKLTFYLSYQIVNLQGKESRRLVFPRTSCFSFFILWGLQDKFLVKMYFTLHFLYRYCTLQHINFCSAVHYICCLSSSAAQHIYSYECVLQFEGKNFFLIFMLRPISFFSLYHLYHFIKIPLSPSKQWRKLLLCPACGMILNVELPLVWVREKLWLQSNMKCTHSQRVLICSHEPSANTGFHVRIYLH